MIHFSLLGRFEVQLESEPFELSSRPAQALLAYVLLHPDVPLRRKKLAGVLWPEAPDSNARSSLRQALWRLGKELGIDLLEASKQSI